KHMSFPRKRESTAHDDANAPPRGWIPACAGMTALGSSRVFQMTPLPGLLTEAPSRRRAILFDGLLNYRPYPFIISRIIGRPSFQKGNRRLISGFLEGKGPTPRAMFLN